MVLDGKSASKLRYFAGVAWPYGLESLFRNKDLSDAVFSIVMSVMASLEVFVPITVLKGVIQKIAMLMPPYWLIHALHNLDGDSVYAYWLSLGILLLFAAVFLIFGSKRRLE